MLTINGIGNAEYLLGSVAVGIEDYYVGSGEAPGVWRGAWPPISAWSGWWTPTTSGRC